MNVNKVFLGGNLTRDPETRPAGSSSVVSFGIAINRKWTNRDGQTNEETTFVDCEAWGKTGEVIAQHMSKGRPIFVEGRLKLDQWQDNDGNSRSKVRVVVDSFQFVGGKADAEKQPRRTMPANATLSEEDIPF